ncbi:LpqB family beta-propeller domain-containing protein [Kitasatospora sp. McL0602]|uniref:LpqB family beta-propeller domain-containing protein n=1 Tax=Kitasatospora sp. McL0602 TaxID=3439530 RepID=UPI003F889184
MTRQSDSRTERRTGLLLAAWAGAGMLLATGCVAMPSDGSPEALSPSQGGAENLQVRVFAVEPHPGADAGDVLSGFLDASNADEADYGTALKYLTADARKRWNPDAGVVVLRTRIREQAKGDDSTAQVAVTGTQVAGLDARHTYRDTIPPRDSAAAPAYRQTFTLVKETEGKDKGEWRIDQLPDGLIADLTSFKNSYRAVHRYFYSSADPSVKSDPQVLVPDPIYVRRRIDPLTAAAKALAAGPSDWLARSVESAVHGVQIVGPVTVSDNLVATVKVSVADFAGQPALCSRMAGQFFYTLADQLPKRQLDRLNLSGAKGSCSVDAGQAGTDAPGSLAGPAGAEQYYLLDNGQLMNSQGKPVQGPLGMPIPSAQPRPSAVAVRRDGGGVAVVSGDHRSLYVVGLGSAEKYGEPVVTSTAHGTGTGTSSTATVSPSGTVTADQSPGLASPSWDGRQNLWVVDRDAGASRVLMVRDKDVIPVDGLEGQQAQQVRVSSDGTRIAVLVHNGLATPQLMVGLVVHSGTESRPQVMISGLRRVSQQLSDIVSFSWADTDQLLVLGKEDNKLQQLHYVGTDGSQSSDTPQQVGDSMVSVSTSETLPAGDSAQPVLAVSSTHQIYRLVGSQWREVGTQLHGTAFSYPG